MQIFFRLVLAWSTVILKAVIIRRIMFKANIVSRIGILALGPLDVERLEIEYQNHG